MAAPFRLREILSAAGRRAEQLARDSAISFSTINRKCTNVTEQVSRKRLDTVSAAPSRVAGRAIEPGDLIQRAPEKGKRGRE